jgi:ketosteroid isomerase-like protein
MRTVLLIVPALVILTSTRVEAQTTKDVLTKFTNDYFDYYNNCSVDKILELCTEDIEVYHDLAGLIDGKPDFGVQSKKFCDWIATPEAPNVKAEIIGDIDIHELRTKGDQLYGAVINGTLSFSAINKQTGAIAQSGIADFTWILRLTGDHWQIARDISYNHKDTSGKK